MTTKPQTDPVRAPQNGVESEEHYRYEFRLSGEGGQGVISGGAILAEAVILHGGKYAVQSPFYGSRVRGGPTRVDVIVSNTPIVYPRATKIDFFLALAQISYEKYATNLADGATILIDTNLVPNVDEKAHKGRHTVLRLPIVEIAKIELGMEVVSNTIALGVMVALTEILPPETLWKSIEARVPKKAIALNRKAFERGMKDGALLKGRENV